MAIVHVPLMRRESKAVMSLTGARDNFFTLSSIALLPNVLRGGEPRFDGSGTTQEGIVAGG